MPDFAVVTAFKATDKMSPVFSKIEGRIRKMTGGLERMVGLGKGSMLRDLMPAAGVTGFIMMGNAVKEAAKQADALKTSFGSVFQGDAANQMSFVRKEANRLGLDFVMAADAYKGIAAAAKGTAISNLDVQQTFLGVSEAATALQLTSEQSQGALLAISQIISKGKVSMEELRGQLGERIPGAMQIAARSMGVTTAELEKLVARGIPAEKFIPRFAAQMRKEFGPAAVDASKKFAASEQRFKDLMFTMKANVGNVLLPVLNDAMMMLTPFIAALAEWMDKNQEMVTSIVRVAVPAIGILAGAYVAATAAQWLWNVAMSANPIGIVIVLVGLLAYAAYDLYKNWDKYLLLIQLKFKEWEFSFLAIKAQVYDLLSTMGLVSKQSAKMADIEARISYTEGKIMAEKYNKMEAPNQARESNRQSIDFQGNLNITGAPNGSTVSSKTRGAPPINMNLVGAQ